jgi:hypothetical protein
LPTNGDDGEPTKNAIRVKNTVVMQATSGTGVGTTITAYVSAVTGLTFTVLPYTAATLALLDLVQLQYLAYLFMVLSLLKGLLEC